MGPSALPGAKAALLVQPAAAVRRGTRQKVRAVQARGTAHLHEVCSSCGVAGMNTLETSKYCGELQQQCQCCKEKVQRKYKEICSGFMGFGGCVEGIKAAMEAKEKECKKKKELADYQREQQKQEIEKASGMDIFDLHAFEVKVRSRKGIDTPYHDECASYNAPNCSAAPLCAFGGCDRTLWTLTADLNEVEDWLGMLKMLPCI
ncbi:unnamed protein product [Cladocopium goreaui]|uniref:Uncharacterized protein n=1 Tax=Cladocopium goreaui TaxID=2562237 RepID=A0A9P1BZR0_9DINO|nr:unnamed protein product [Cladocopium goreaui]